MAKFCDRIKSLRGERGLPQEKFAQEIGASKGTVSVWERGVRIPEFATLDKLCDFFNVPLGYLIGEIDDRQQSEEPDDAFLSESVILSNARSIASIANTMARLSPSTFKIIAGAIAAAYREDKTNDILEPSWRYNTKIEVKLKQDGAVELIDAHDDK